MKVCVVIPARYSSSRFPGKPLVNLLYKPMIIWVADIAARAVGIEHVYVATDDTRIADAVTSYGYKFIETSPHALTGTDRVAEASKQIDYDIYINVQGDEPTIDHLEILKCIQLKKENFDCVVNGYCTISTNSNPSSKNIPKVVKTEKNRLVYMSRSLVPGFKDLNIMPKEYLKQVCIYGFSFEELQLFSNYGRKSLLEQSEDIEILRFLDLGKQVLMYQCAKESLAVDVPSDIQIVEDYLQPNK
ncbi:3-deoxy-manno-octulosonate cytidylyltransferase [Parasynechococcus marenigrum]|uniref:CMP-KDO synthetase n=1 Tax=Parasynechococcus marenigrum (strain WH8102) TaxID=84588 RepID=Q7U934_PARMW|nr:3-deoxy-manno-octulosonate cytidylyltransferase [Parasynechococcus marenigrum]CAE06940.1 Putative CMP-KDO synthetase [Parasynechococcus marenigrum WH 8102]